MKIGEFARINQVTIDTVRYYIKLGLLSPGREGLRHIFDERCLKRMDEIRHYKSLGFPLQEIQRLMSTRYLFNGRYRIKKETVLSLLKDKSREVEDRIKKEREALERLNSRIKELESDRMPSNNANLPWDILDLLACPRCEGPLSPGPESRKKGEITDGLTCPCGYLLDVENFILSEKKDFGGLIHKDDENFIVQFIKEGQNSELVRAMDRIIKQESQRIYGAKGNILCLYNLPDLPIYEAKEDGYYILVSDDREYLNMVRESLCRFGGLENFILIHSSIDQIPLKADSISSIYDFFYSDMASLTNSQRYLERLVPLLNEEGDYLHIGIFLDEADKPERFRRNQVTREFQSRGLILQESAIRIRAPREQLLSKSIVRLAGEQGYRMSPEDLAYIGSQYFKLQARGK